MRRLTAALGLLIVVTSTFAAGRAPDPRCWTVDTADGAVGQCDAEGTFHTLGVTAFEPTMGAAPDGSLYYATTPRGGVAVGFGAGISASRDGGQTWEDVTPEIAGQYIPPETNDPYAYVDPFTGRAFAFHMGPILTCSILSWTDDGGQTWDFNPVGCAPTGVWDHQTMVAAPPTDGTTTLGYPNVLVSCVNAIYAAECGRSLDGGRTWQHTVPVHLNTDVATEGCGAQHGHLASDTSGFIYLPTSQCGKNPAVYISRNSGLTWEPSIINEMDMPFEDPAVQVDAEGTIYASWHDNLGQLWFATSRDVGATWSGALRITPPQVVSLLPTMVVGDPGHIAIFFAGTDDRAFLVDDGSEDFEVEAEEVAWGAYVTYATNANAGAPMFTTIDTTGDDPIMRGDVCPIEGRCTYQIDFIGSTITPDGQIFGSLIDGCLQECVEDEERGNDVAGTGWAIVATVPGLDLCAETCPKFPVAS